MSKPDQSAARPPAPAGFVYLDLLVASVNAAAEWFEVTPRTIRNWLAGGAPAIFCDGKPPLIHVPTLERWLEGKRKSNWDFGRHGGLRW